MNNIFTYIKFRGDLKLDAYPFNEVDALVFSALSYIHFENIVPTVGEDGAVSLAQAAKNYVKAEGKEKAFYARYERLLDAAAQSPRYAHLLLSNYISATDLEERQQFAALHIQIDPSLTFIAFRGTDETLVGWREDFDMCYMMPVPAQISALNYINETAADTCKAYIIGGHSKGGNLALYSGVFCQPEIQTSIREIYDFDGPGFNQSMAADESYLRLKDRIRVYVPEFSVVGMLMEHEETYQVVKSNGSTFMQHDILTWRVDGTKFELSDGTGQISSDVSAITKLCLERTDLSERKMFVDALFEVFKAGGITDIFGFKEIGVQKTGAMMKAAAELPKEQREMVGRFIKLLFDESRKSVHRKVAQIF